MKRSFSNKLKKKKKKAGRNETQQNILYHTSYELNSTLGRMEISSTALPQNCESYLKNRSWNDPSGPPQDEVSSTPVRPRLRFTPVKSFRRSLTRCLPAFVFVFFNFPFLLCLQENKARCVAAQSVRGGKFSAVKYLSKFVNRFSSFRFVLTQNHTGFEIRLTNESPFLQSSTSTVFLISISIQPRLPVSFVFSPVSIIIICYFSPLFPL